MAPLLEHLKTVNDRIQAYQPHGRHKFEDFLNWVGHDFLDNVMQLAETKNYFESVRLYFEGLKDSDRYKSTLARMFALIREMKPLVSSQEYLAEARTHLRGDYINLLHLVQKDTLSPEEFLNLCDNEENYQVICGQGSWGVDDVAPGCSNKTVLDQYRSVGNLFRLLFGVMRKDDQVNSKYVHQKLEEYFGLLNELEDMLITEPTRLHFKAYWWLYNVYESLQPGANYKLRLAPDEHRREDIKEWTRTVLEDLIAHAAMIGGEGAAPAQNTSDILYEIKYDGQKIFMNSVYVGRTEMMGPPDEIFKYFYEHPNQRVTREEILEAAKLKTKRTLPDIIKDLGFVGPIKEAFFPGLSSNGGMFINPVTYTDAKDRNLSMISFSQPRKIGKKNVELSEDFEKKVKAVFEKMPPKPAVFG